MKKYKFQFDIYEIKYSNDASKTQVIPLGFYFIETESKNPTQEEILEYLKDNYFHIPNYSDVDPHVGLNPFYNDTYFTYKSPALYVWPLTYIVVNNVRRI